MRFFYRQKEKTAVGPVYLPNASESYQFVTAQSTQDNQQGRGFNPRPFTFAS